ncbi:MAG: hypothetical protein IPO92_15365 [Saprospiraceae bacterium]|nr:hypothetical protein [Saprospiraceae bacterium]
MKNIIFILIFALTGNIYASVCNVNIVLNNQAAVNSFNSTYGCDSIMGNLSITGGVTSLAGLSNIKYIQGYLTIEYTNLVTTFGMSNLKKVDGLFNIYLNASLTNVEGWNQLTDIGGNLAIQGNPMLIDVKLDKLKNIGYTSTDPSTNLVGIYGNASLTTLNTFKSLKQYNGELTFGGNTLLQSIMGFDSLEIVTSIRIYDQNLNNINGFGKVDSLDKFYINGSNNL